jgi:hypothetical protein
MEPHGGLRLRSSRRGIHVLAEELNDSAQGRPAGHEKRPIKLSQSNYGKIKREGSFSATILLFVKSASIGVHPWFKILVV